MMTQIEQLGDTVYICVNVGNENSVEMAYDRALLSAYAYTTINTNWGAIFQRHIRCNIVGGDVAFSLAVTQCTEQVCLSFSRIN